MQEPPKYLSDEAKERIHAAKNAAQADEVARVELAERAATEAAVRSEERLAEKIVDEERLAVIVRKQLQYVLSEGSETNRSIILARVPYICADIKAINANVQELKELLGTYPVVKSLVFGVVSMILTSVVGALLALVIMK